MLRSATATAVGRRHAVLAAAVSATSASGARRTIGIRPSSHVPGQDSNKPATMYARRAETIESTDSGVTEHAPRAVGDFRLDSPDQVIPGAHPLPLTNGDAEATLWPLVSPYQPSPQREHPYFTGPTEDFPHFECSVPVVYPSKVLKTPIVLPVFDTATGTVSHTRAVDPYVFGQYPELTRLSNQAYYWVVRNQNYKAHWELGKWEIFRKRKKNWPNTGMGLRRVNNRRDATEVWGGRHKPNKPWNVTLPRAEPYDWHTACRMSLALKVLQGKVMVVDRLTLEKPTTEAFRELCERMNWDVRSTGAGVLFMDGGSRLKPSMEFDRAFFYGSFVQGKVKVVRPTIRVDEPYDWNLRQEFRMQYQGPRGQKNPVPINRFNIFDALDHHLLVMTEGAVLQLEREMFAVKVLELPPHIRNQMADMGLLDHHLTGTVAAPLGTIEEEAAGRAEERERPMYKGYYDDPYRPWHDEARAAYVVDTTQGFIRRQVEPAAEGSDDAAADVPATAEGGATKPKWYGSWRRIQ